MLKFNFQPYLSSLLSVPPNRISIEVLTGGISNVTARATFSPPADLSKFGLSQSVDSIVLKYAPPFMPDDPTQMMPVARQSIEARALALLSPHSKNALPLSPLFTKYPSVKIPRLIHHDTENNVLSMTDLGQAQTLYNWLVREPAPPVQDAEHIATVLGSFLAEFALATRNPTAEILAHASNSALTDNYYGSVVKMTRKVLTEAGIADAETLAMRVDRVSRDLDKAEPCLGMVDLWAGNVLVDSHRNCGLVDWEYFGLSSPSFELSRLITSFQYIQLRTKSSEDTLTLTRAFTKTLLRNYALHAPAPSLHFKRQALIIQGGDLINALGEGGAEFDDDMKQRAFDAGVRSLRAAGDSEQSIDLSFFDDALPAYESLYERVTSILSAR